MNTAGSACRERKGKEIDVDLIHLKSSAPVQTPEMGEGGWLEYHSCVVGQVLALGLQVQGLGSSARVREKALGLE